MENRSFRESDVSVKKYKERMNVYEHHTYNCRYHLDRRGGLSLGRRDPDSLRKVVLSLVGKADSIYFFGIALLNHCQRHRLSRINGAHFISRHGVQTGMGIFRRTAFGIYSVGIYQDGLEEHTIFQEYVKSD